MQNRATQTARTPAQAASERAATVSDNHQPVQSTSASIDYNIHPSSSAMSSTMSPSSMSLPIRQRPTTNGDISAMMDLLQSKLTESPAEIVLTKDEVRQVVDQLKNQGKIAAELSQVKEDLKEIRCFTRFVNLSLDTLFPASTPPSSQVYNRKLVPDTSPSRYGDYAKEIWTDMKASNRKEDYDDNIKLPQRPATAVRRLSMGDGESRSSFHTAFSLAASNLKPSVQFETASVAVEAYAARNVACHAPIEDLRAAKDFIALTNLVERDLGDLVDCLPDSQSAKLKEWKSILGYFQAKTAPLSNAESSESEDADPMQSSSDKNNLHSSEEAIVQPKEPYIKHEALINMPPSTAEFLFEQSHFASWPQYPSQSKSSLPKDRRRGPSDPFPDVAGSKRKWSEDISSTPASPTKRQRVSQDGGQMSRAPGEREFHSAVDTVRMRLIKLREGPSFNLPAAVQVVGKVDEAAKRVIEEELSEAERRATAAGHDA